MKAIVSGFVKASACKTRVQNSYNLMELYL